jgi:hypothetical protein
MVTLPPIPPLHAATGAARGQLRRRRPLGSLVPGHSLSIPQPPRDHPPVPSPSDNMQSTVLPRRDPLLPAAVQAPDRAHVEPRAAGNDHRRPGIEGGRGGEVERA